MMILHISSGKNSSVTSCKALKFCVLRSSRNMQILLTIQQLYTWTRHVTFSMETICILYQTSV